MKHKNIVAFLSLLTTWTGQEIIPHGRQELNIYCILSSRWSGDTRSQCINSHCIGLIVTEYHNFSTRRKKNAFWNKSFTWNDMTALAAIGNLMMLCNLFMLSYDDGNIHPVSHQYRKLGDHADCGYSVPGTVFWKHEKQSVFVSLNIFIMLFRTKNKQVKHDKICMHAMDTMSI